MERTDTELQAAGIREADVSVQLTKEVQARSEPRLRHRCTSQRRVSVLNPGKHRHLRLSGRRIFKGLV
jgi:hypothetical protein